jgi:hypothetical protein
MTRQDYIMMSECIAECHNMKYNLNDTIGYFKYRLHGHRSAKRFNATKFKEFVLEKTKPDHIPEEQAKEWAIKTTAIDQ